MGLCGQTPTLVPVDAAGRPVRAALTWQDIRARPGPISAQRTPAVDATAAT